MKKFKFYALAFAAIAFAGCSDDVIDGQGASGTQGDGTPAYLTISFTANGGNSSRSTADDANNTGDHDGTVEDSEHHTPGTSEETAIKKALVVVYSESGKKSFAKLYGASEFTNTTPGQGDGFVITDVNSQSYVSAAPIEVETGDYKVLVVINPVAALTTDVMADNVSITDNTKIKTLYDRILTGAYSDAEATSFSNAAENIGNSTDGFMMTNKEASNVTLTSDNTQAQPEVADVTVERTLSKITYRTKKTNNIYPVEVNTGTVKARTVTGAILSGDTYTKVTLNVAVDSDKPQGNVVYAYYTGTEGSEVLTGVYKQRSGQTQMVDSERLTVYEEVEAATEEAYDAMEDAEKADYFVTVDFDGNTTISNEEIERSLILQGDEGEATGTGNKWYVQLKGYALVNLSKSVNYVRHTATESDDDKGTPFGTLNGTTNFLWTPNWKAKNAVSLETATITGANDWFYNTLADVSAESKTLTSSTISSAKYYKVMPTAVDGETVTGGTGEGAQHTNPLDKTGALMSYCFENSTDIDHQIHGISTGISFMAEIYTDENCQIPLSTPLYRYAGHLYTGLDEIQKAYGSSTPQAIKDLITQGDKATDEDFEAANVVKYNGNTCYYYTTEIKHFDNNDPTALGNMEFAIMRNNIYSLSVTNIAEIGDPFVDPTPNMPNESDEAYISVNTVMEPWIVRYNDIEFD